MDGYIFDYPKISKKLKDLHRVADNGLLVQVEATSIFSDGYSEEAILSEANTILDFLVDGINNNWALYVGDMIYTEGYLYKVKQRNYLVTKFQRSLLFVLE